MCMNHIHVHIYCSIAVLTGMSGIVTNLRNFTKKSGKCQENVWVFSKIRKKSGVFYNGEIFFDQCDKKELNVKWRPKTSYILEWYI